MFPAKMPQWMRQEVMLRNRMAITRRDLPFFGVATPKYLNEKKTFFFSIQMFGCCDTE